MILKNKAAIVTGTADELAKSVALEFLKEGANVVFADKEKKVLNEIEKELKVGKDRVLFCPTDPTKKEDINAMVAAALKKFGTVDILVNDLGDVQQKPFIITTDEDFDFAVNMVLRPSVWCIKAVLPFMQKNSYGKIINSVCTSGKLGIPTLTYLCMVRHALIGITRSLAAEMASYPININAVLTSVLETSTAKKRMVPSFKDISDFRTDATPMGRNATTDEVARLYVFLASDDSAYMTGQTINFTGGFEMK